MKIIMLTRLCNIISKFVYNDLSKIIHSLREGGCGGQSSEAAQPLGAESALRETVGFPAP